MKRKSKVKIKSIPRFIKSTVISLVIVVMIAMVVVTLITNISTAFNTQKEKSQMSSYLVDTSRDTATDVVEQQTKTDAAASTNDPLESIKARLRSGDTAGIKVV